MKYEVDPALLQQVVVTRPVMATLDVALTDYPPDWLRPDPGPRH